ncbi:MAG: hypothetical protein ISS82_02480 [Nanoarchaeota archaeon]|nr:hypothetical protein [Nanoarchaeota archaeon]
MKKRYLAFFVFLIGVFLVCGIIAEDDTDYKEIIREVDKPVEVSAVLNNDDVSIEDSKEDKEEIKEQLRELGYLD